MPRPRGCQDRQQLGPACCSRCPLTGQQLSPPREGPDRYPSGRLARFLQGRRGTLWFVRNILSGLTVTAALLLTLVAPSASSTTADATTTVQNECIFPYLDPPD